jgi:translation initiation factor 2 subunit 3
VNHISFVDCPGHQELIQTMLSSISLMDGAIIVIAVDQPMAMKPQLIQHLAAAKLAKLTKIIVCMNKIDLVSIDTLREYKKELDNLLAKYSIVPYAIIPTCFNKRIGLSHLLNAIMKLFNPTDYLERIESKTYFAISRTFDINKPGTQWDEVSGGVIGGSLLSGKFEVGDKIEIRPGQISKGPNDQFVCQPIQTTILSIKTDTCDLKTIVPGGLIGIKTDMDPFYCKNDALSGSVAGLVGTLPNIYTSLTIDVKLVTLFGFDWVPTINDMVMLQIGTKISEAKLTQINGTCMLFDLTKPNVVVDNQHIIICKNIGKILRIVAEGTIELV